MTIETRIAKNGSKRYYVRDDNGKLRQIRKAQVEEIEADNNTEAEIENGDENADDDINYSGITEDGVRPDGRKLDEVRAGFDEMLRLLKTDLCCLCAERHTCRHRSHHYSKYKSCHILLHPDVDKAS